MSDRANGSAGDLKQWQRRIFWSVWVTYFAYYLCRYNMPVAKTTLCQTYAWDAERFGIVLSALTLTYAFGQFVNGQLADRFGTRLIASLGILGSVVMNAAVFVLLLVAEPDAAGSQPVLTLLAVFWGINGFFQAMGWTPMVKAMAHWYPVSRRGKVMGMMGTCYQFGGAFATLVALFLVGYFAEELGGDRRHVFLVPAIMLTVVGVFFFWLIRNRPEDVGLPTVNVEDEPTRAAGGTAGVTITANVLRTFRNPYLWILAWTFFLLDVNRYGFVNWLPAFLDAQGVGDASPLLANFKKAMTLCIHPLAGSAGAILAGWASANEVPAGRPAPWMCLRNAEQLGVYPMEACVKIGDTVPDIEEGLNAGMWTVGLAKSGNEMGLNEKEIAALPADQRQARLDRACQRLTAAGAHYVVDTIADELPVIDRIRERIAVGERP